MEGLVIDPAFWRGRRVFVTGHTGFTGGWMTLLLERLGAQVYGYALAPPTQPSLFDVAVLAPALRQDVRGDIEDAVRLAEAVTMAAPEVLIHLAAQPLVLESYRAPAQTYATNVMGTVHVLEALRAAPSLKGAVIVTSDKCYRNDTGGPFTEDAPLGGADPYSSSKACAELVTAAYRASFFAKPGEGACNIATARAGNVIGGGDWAKDRLVPDCVRAFQARTPVVLRRPGALRPWQHVLDAVAGYLALAQRLCGPDGARYAAAWNFGPAARDVVPVEIVAGEVMRALGGSVVKDEAATGLPEAAVLLLDNTRAAQALEWRPRLPLPAALAETSAWYAAWAKGADMAALTRAQIDRYLAA